MMSVAEAKDASCTRRFRMSVARAIAAQVIQAVFLLHHRGVVHAGIYTDITVSVILTIYRPTSRQYHASLAAQHR